MFAAFILIAGLLAATSVRALLTLEHLARQGRESARHAVTLTEQSQRLAEQSLAMERSARQFLVLDDPLFRDRYLAAWQQAEAALLALEGVLPDVAPGQGAAWRTQGKAAWDALNAGRRKHGQALVAAAFTRLPLINDQIVLDSKRAIERGNDALLGELERQRALLAALVAGALVLAAGLATCFGFLLSRPLRRIKQAISLLGENRFDVPIVIGGPADTRLLGQQLDWLRLRLAELKADKERFLRHVSHELKTPLSALREGVALLEDGVAGPLGAGQAEIAAILRQNTASLHTQIDELLRYNTAAFDAQRLERQDTELLGLLTSVVESQRLQAQARRVRVVLGGTAVSGQFDRDKLATALANVLSNALRFSPEDGLVELSLGSVGDRACIDCIDQGPGVAPDDGPRIFEPFYQGERQAPGARLGNGIGLSIVREYIAAHGGSVTLLARPSGAHFQIELPL